MPHLTNTLPYRLFRLNKTAIRNAKDPYPLNGPALGTQVLEAELAKLHSCNYVAVSHPWGTTPPRFPMTGIPWTVPTRAESKILFILKACERRGYEYVWLDVLCINQTLDDPAAEAERNIEIGMMQQYYKDAHATIVIGEHWNEFPGRWSRVDDAFREWDGKAEKPIDPNWDGLDAIDQIVKDSWFHRVWTLQETVLPLTTAPHDTIVVNPPPYYPARLLTAEGHPMDVRGLCDLIDWTYVALGKVEFGTRSKYPWIHPGAGVVNDNGWWMTATVQEAIGLGATSLHPLQALGITRYRNSYEPIDALKGVSALMDKEWHVTENTLDEAWKTTTNRYIERREGALLLGMAVTKSAQRSWGAGIADDSLGSYIPDSGVFKIISATVEAEGALRLKVSGNHKVNIPVTSNSPYGDGSGELYKLLSDLDNLEATHDISSVCALLALAIAQSQIPHSSDLNSLEAIQKIAYAHGNAISSGLRAVFSGWNRWIISVDQASAAPRVFVAWLPHEEKDKLGKYSLLWICHGKNEWAVVVKESGGGRYRKVGIAYVNDTIPINSETETEVVIE